MLNMWKHPRLIVNAVMPILIESTPCGNQSIRIPNSRIRKWNQLVFQPLKAWMHRIRLADPYALFIRMWLRSTIPMNTKFGIVEWCSAEAAQNQGLSSSRIAEYAQSELLSIEKRL